MVDDISQKQRSCTMSKIRSTMTEPELRMKPVLEALGFMYQPKIVYGRPDFANKSEKVALFIDGCFWHKCPVHYVAPKSNEAYWAQKIERNVKRDKTVNEVLAERGWKVVRIWEHELRGHSNEFLAVEAKS